MAEKKPYSTPKLTGPFRFKSVRLTQYPGSNRYRCDGCSSEFVFCPNLDGELNDPNFCPVCGKSNAAARNY